MFKDIFIIIIIVKFLGLLLFKEKREIIKSVDVLVLLVVMVNFVFEMLILELNILLVV